VNIEKVRLIYFSPTGSTEKILNYILKGLGLDIFNINTTNLTVPVNRKECMINDKVQIDIVDG